MQEKIKRKIARLRAEQKLRPEFASLIDLRIKMLEWALEREQAKKAENGINDGLSPALVKNYLT